MPAIWLCFMCSLYFEGYILLEREAEAEKRSKARGGSGGGGDGEDWRVWPESESIGRVREGEMVGIGTGRHVCELAWKWKRSKTHTRACQIKCCSHEADSFVRYLNFDSCIFQQ